MVVSIYTGRIRAYDVMRMLQRDGNLTPLGDAIAAYGRIFKTLHILTYAVEEPYRRDIKGIRNLQESRHALAGKILHGRKGEVYHRYYKGMRTSSARSGWCSTASRCETPSTSIRPWSVCGRRAG
ncbi:hypothetical protein GCM10020001_104600 [Nonomuraea salmonea]